MTGKIEIPSEVGDWLSPLLAAIALIAFVAVFIRETYSFRDAVVAWANRDLDARSALAASNLEEPIRTQDFRRIHAFGEICANDGVRLSIRSFGGGLVFDTRPKESADNVFWKWRTAAGCRVGLGVPYERVLAPFRRALVGFVLAGLVGVAGVFLFFVVTYRQRVRIRELARLERFRREFIADVSHEIKTPLTGILGAVDLLSDIGVSSSEERRSMLTDMISRSARRLNALVQSILDLARLEREGVVVRRVEVELNELMDDTLSGLQQQAESAQVRLTHVRSGTCRAACDVTLVSQALANLVVNAIRHAHAPEVLISCHNLNHAAQLVVEDHGVGIPKEEADRIFERFHRVDPARSAETGGAGLGLAIVRRIARLHGGEVVYEPVQPTGSRFIVTFM